jgi:hypothetical protein
MQRENDKRPGRGNGVEKESFRDFRGSLFEIRMRLFASL